MVALGGWWLGDTRTRSCCACPTAQAPPWQTKDHFKNSYCIFRAYSPVTSSIGSLAPAQGTQPVEAGRALGHGPAAQSHNAMQTVGLGEPRTPRCAHVGAGQRQHRADFAQLQNKIHRWPGSKPGKFLSVEERPWWNGEPTFGGCVRAWSCAELGHNCCGCRSPAQRDACAQGCDCAPRRAPGSAGAAASRGTQAGRREWLFWGLLLFWGWVAMVSCLVTLLGDGFGTGPACFTRAAPRNRPAAGTAWPQRLVVAAGHCLRGRMVPDEQQVQGWSCAPLCMQPCRS